MELVVTMAMRWVEFSIQSKVVEALSCLKPTTVTAGPRRGDQAGRTKGKATVKPEDANA